MIITCGLLVAVGFVESSSPAAAVTGDMKDPRVAIGNSVGLHLFEESLHFLTDALGSMYRKCQVDH